MAAHTRTEWAAATPHAPSGERGRGARRAPGEDLLPPWRSARNWQWHKYIFYNILGISVLAYLHKCMLYVYIAIFLKSVSEFQFQKSVLALLHELVGILLVKKYVHRIQVSKILMQCLRFKTETFEQNNGEILCVSSLIATSSPKAQYSKPNITQCTRTYELKQWWPRRDYSTANDY